MSNSPECQASAERSGLWPNPSPPDNPGTCTRNQISYQFMLQRRRKLQRLCAPRRSSGVPVPPENSVRLSGKGLAPAAVELRRPYDPDVGLGRRRPPPLLSIQPRGRCKDDELPRVRKIMWMSATDGLQSGLAACCGPDHCREGLCGVLRQALSPLVTTTTQSRRNTSTGDHPSATSNMGRSFFLTLLRASAMVDQSENLL